MPERPSERLAYTIAEAVGAGAGARSSLYRAINAGELIARKRGRRTVILADDLRRWLHSLKPIKAA